MVLELQDGVLGQAGEFASVGSIALLSSSLSDGTSPVASFV
jgi:hypothetical protein